MDDIADRRPLDVLSKAVEQTSAMLDLVGPHNADQPTPCVQWSIGELADHLVADAANLTAMARGEQPDWSASPHLSEGWGSEFRRRAGELVDAWRGAGGDPAMAIAELTVHSWDLATALDRASTELDPDAAELALEFMRANLRPEMRGEAFAPERAEPHGAGPYGRLAAFAGRHVEPGAA